jgi:hypothetical protein
VSKTRTWTVQVPIAGHAILEVEAESAESAIEAALNSNDLTHDKIETWEALERFNQGNVCYCPHPWHATAELAFGEDPIEDDETV